MYQIRHLRLVKPLAFLVAALMIFPYVLTSSAAHAQTFAEITSAAVVPVQDQTGAESVMVSEKATDALAMALEDSGEFRVISKRELQVALSEFSLAPPLMALQ